MCTDLSKESTTCPHEVVLGKGKTRSICLRKGQRKWPCTRNHPFIFHALKDDASHETHTTMYACMHMTSYMHACTWHANDESSRSFISSCTREWWSRQLDSLSNDGSLFCALMKSMSYTCCGLRLCMLTFDACVLVKWKGAPSAPSV